MGVDPKTVFAKTIWILAGTAIACGVLMLMFGIYAFSMDREHYTLDIFCGAVFFLTGISAAKTAQIRTYSWILILSFTSAIVAVILIALSSRSTEDSSKQVGISEYTMIVIGTVNLLSSLGCVLICSQSIWFTIQKEQPHVTRERLNRLRCASESQQSAGFWSQLGRQQ